MWACLFKYKQILDDCRPWTRYALYADSCYYMGSPPIDSSRLRCRPAAKTFRNDKLNVGFSCRAVLARETRLDYSAYA